MRKQIIVIGLSLFLAIQGNAQNTAAKSDDASRIALTTYVPQQIENMPEIARTMLANKLSQIATQNGMGSNQANPRFIITANVTVLTKDLTPTAPPMNALTLDVTLYIGDGMEGTKFSSTSVTVKGVGANETKAYVEALKNIKTVDPAIQSFVTSGKNKILEYYNSKCDFIIKEAQTLESQNKYEECIYKLTSVPNLCKDCYDKCMTAVGPAYQKLIDRQCKVKLAEAKASWAAAQNAEGAASAASVLGSIDPSSACYKEANALSADIAKRIKEIDKREWDFKMKVQSDEIALQKQQLSACKEIGLAYASALSKTTVYNIRWW